MTPPDAKRVAEVAETQALLADLARVKALFQARAIAAVIGVPPPDHLRSLDQ